MLTPTPCPCPFSSSAPHISVPTWIRVHQWFQLTRCHGHHDGVNAIDCRLIGLIVRPLTPSTSRRSNRSRSAVILGADGDMCCCPLKGPYVVLLTGTYIYERARSLLICRRVENISLSYSRSLSSFLSTEFRQIPTPTWLLLSSASVSITRSS